MHSTHFPRPTPPFDEQLNCHERSESRNMAYIRCLQEYRAFFRVRHTIFSRILSSLGHGYIPLLYKIILFFIRKSFLYIALQIEGCIFSIDGFFLA